MSKTSTLLSTSALTLGLLLPLQATLAQSVNAQDGLKRAMQTRAQWASSGLTNAQLRVSSAHSDASSHLDYVHVQQIHQGIPVYNRISALAFVDEKLVHHAGKFLADSELTSLPTAPTIPAGAAVARAIQVLELSGTVSTSPLAGPSGTEQQQTFAGGDVARRDIVASLVWAPDKNGQLHLAWNINIDVASTPDWWNVRIDATTGAFVEKDNWTVHERNRASQRKPAEYGAALPAALIQPLLLPPTTTGSTYYVVPFPKESPAGNTYATETNPWLKAGSSNNATTHGWHFDGTTNYLYTRGNNVQAYEDSDANNLPATGTGSYASSSTSAPSLTFNYVPDFSLSPTTATNRSAAVVNLFYWNNITHDIMYQYGFTEAAGNFQKDNLSRGGTGNDHVLAEAQDGSGTDNANFSTPNDGSSGRMQMYLFTAAPPKLQVTAPAAIAGSYYMAESGFSTANKLVNKGPISGQVVRFDDAGTNPVTHQACTTPVSAAALSGKIVLIDRGNCDFVTKVKQAQTAGAKAVIVVNNVAGSPGVMGGTDNTITIPAIMVSQEDGALLVGQLANGVSVTLPKPLATDPQLDGDLDNGVVVHEYGHGISTRLTGGPANSSCLNNAEEGGEGWSDFFALMLTTDWQTAQLTDGPKSRPMGTYASGQPVTGSGIRLYPYSTSMSINPLTYTDVAIDPEVHSIGEVWCAALWDMTWNIIQQEGTIEPNLYNSASTSGNIIAMQLVVQGLKLQPCQPGFLDARDAILAADELLYKGKHRCAIWNAFARRGMGVDAKQGLSTSATDQTAGFNVPSSVNLKKATEALSGNSFSIALTATCDCAVPASTYKLTDDLPAGLQYVSSTGGTLSGSTVTFSNVKFTAINQSLSFSINAQTDKDAGCATIVAVNENADAATTSFTTPKAGSTSWGTSNTYANSGTKSWASGAPTQSKDFSLVSGSFTPTTASTLSFYHFYSFESGYDGGTVEISSNSGTTWTDAAPYFISNGYNSAYSANGAAPNQPCFTGLLPANADGSKFIKSVINLSSFSGKAIKVRFRVRCDRGTGNQGWFVDDIQVSNGCGGDQVVKLTDTSTSSLVSSTSIATFLSPPSPVTLPVTLMQFDGRWQSAGALLTWATAFEEKSDRFEVERSLDGINSWTTVGQVKAAGTSTSRHDYQLLDALAQNQPSGLLYYRLRQVDRDGQARYSLVRTVARPATKDMVQLAAQPNPFGTDGLRLQLRVPAAQPRAYLTLHNAAGKQLMQQTITPLAAGSTTVVWPQAARLPAGLYLVRMQLPNGSGTMVRVVRE
ncbi:M36 family metallopeptidase [Hymenobacter sp. BT730]|uniref:M36 family metallopeptidase n=1 Tax=Hymenobacter sp. BT730 TaxID=3063332 RepID=UPI0026DF189C|nr:M36 family metallopeptidase [Hymenobacter sp. BT730]